ncbi:MAG TPA: carboxypeptidase-like regulatory domain-containing protein, partial [Pyrinomonadaceae bacterium]|nr:carboxypeptidase-like regulatory domain-containing protein [Pyrinomonadaceae bacterium]
MRVLPLIFILTTSVLTCFAQSNPSLEVVVRDPSGALINKAQVQLIRNGKPHSSAQTNQRGEARFGKVPPGQYQLHIEAAGFKAQTLETLDLSAGVHRKEVLLEIDEIKVDVDVADEAQVRNTDPKGPA